MEHDLEVMSEKEALRAHGGPGYRDAAPAHPHETADPVAPAPTVTGESAIPLVRQGGEPGYEIPESVSTWGLARGANWLTTSISDIRWCGPRWEEMRRLCDICFTATNHSNIVYIDRHDTHDVCSYMFSRIPELINRYPRASSFGGCLDRRYPWQLSTDTVGGPSTIEYTVAFTLEHSQSVTQGWAVGGSAGFNLGPLGASVTTEYSHSRTNSTSWARTGTASSNAPVAAGEWGRIDVFGTGGLYGGYLFFSTATLPIHPNSGGKRCFDIGNRHILTTYPHYAFPVRGAFVKSPNSPSPLVRTGRLWAQGASPPSTELSPPSGGHAHN